jgi:hypothetical protein
VVGYIPFFVKSFDKILDGQPLSPLQPIGRKTIDSHHKK